MERSHGVKFLKYLFAWAAASASAGAVGSIVQTQFNLAAIAAVGAPVPLPVRLQTTLQDLAGFAPMLIAVSAAGFLVAFLVSGWLARRLPRQRTLLHTLAGALATGAALASMHASMPITIIGAARSLTGSLALCAAGALGGFVFALLAPRRIPPRIA
jgi:MFS family permease